MNYKVHKYNLKMTRDQDQLEQFLNSLGGEVVAIVPNVSINFLWIHKIDFLLIIEKLEK